MTNEKTIMHIKGLQCDNPNCDYRDDEILFKDYEKYVDAPCPLCSQPILTLADYRAVNLLVALSDAEVVDEPLPESEADNRIRGRYQFNGSGKPEMIMDDEHTFRILKAEHDKVKESIKHLEKERSRLVRLMQDHCSHQHLSILGYPGQPEEDVRYKCNDCFTYFEEAPTAP